MMDIIQRRRAPRYQIRNDDGLTVTVRKTDDTVEHMEVQLLDLSVGGARIKADTLFPVKQILAVKIVTESPRLAISITGEVCWVAPAIGDDWSIGCSFKPQIPTDVLHDFAESGVIERREHRRHQTCRQAMAMWELRAETSAVQVIDYSKGGYCLSSLAEPNLGESMLLRLDSEAGEVTIKGKIKWYVETEAGFVLGCEYADPQDYDLLNPPSTEQPKVFDECRYHLWYRLPRAAVAFAAVLLLALLAGQMLPNPESANDSPVSTTTDSNDLMVGTIVETHRPVSINFERATIDAVAKMDIVPNRRSFLVKSVPAKVVQVRTDLRPAPTYRTWMDNTGQYKTFASLVSVENDVVTLRKENGRYASVPLNRLCDDDHELIRQWLHRRSVGE